MFDVANVNLHFGARHVLKDASLRVGDGERAAIIGPNGAGKSTLLKIVAGLISPEGGSVTTPKNTDIGYLPQEVVIDTPLTVEEECRTVFQEVLDHEREMRRIEHRMAEITDHAADEYLKLADRYDYLLHETLRRDIYSMDATIGKVLAGLGFKPEDLKRPCREFSGGWQMRIALGKLLLSNPDILLLDEPTNHLDIESITWLGEWLSNHEGSILMVSHERAFMDRLVNKVIEIDRGKVIVYRGNYTKSQELRTERREQQRRAHENQAREIAQAERFIERFKAKATKAAQAQSRIKKLERIEVIEAPEEDAGTIAFRFPPAPRSGKEVLVGAGLSKRFGSNEVFRNADFQLYRGEKVALVGVNGAGKTTLMRILAGKMKPSDGTVTVGSNVLMDYFAQYDYEDLHPDNTVLGEFLSAAPLAISGRSRDILGAFLFRDDDVEKKISVLSGGEKTRLRLSKMLCGSTNLLLMDEPTNHLDLGSRLTLEAALRQYEGAVVLVSHDRYFLDNVVTRVVEISQGEVRSFPGNYADYLRFKELGANAARQPMPVKTGTEGEEKRVPGHEDRRRVQAERSKLNKELSRERKRAEELEEAVARLDELCRSLENQMESASSDAEKLVKLSAKLEASRRELEEAEGSWAAAQERAERLDSELERLEA